MEEERTSVFRKRLKDGERGGEGVLFMVNVRSAVMLLCWFDYFLSMNCWYQRGHVLHEKQQMGVGWSYRTYTWRSLYSFICGTGPTHGVAFTLVSVVPDLPDLHVT